MSEEKSAYRPVSRPYVKRFSYLYRRHAFDKLREIDLPLAEFQGLFDGAEVIGEAEVGVLTHKELVLLLQRTGPLDVAILVDEGRAEERIVTVYEPDPSEWTADYRRRR
jgi:hypothetical protein